MALLKQSTARNRLFIMVSSTDHIAVKTGAAPVVNLSKNGAAFGAAAGAVTEIANGFYQVALTTADTNTLGDLAYHVTGTGADPTQFVDQVVAFDPADAAALGLSRLDAAVSSRLASGNVTVATNNDKTGYSLTTAPPTVAQMWGEPVPAAYAVGSAGNIVGNRLDVAVSTRATSTAGGTVGPGSRQVTINVQHPGSTGPLEGAACWVSTDQAGTNVIAGTLHTDTSGNVQFMLDNGTYWLWRQLSPYLFTPNPQSFTVS